MPPRRHFPGPSCLLWRALSRAARTRYGGSPLHAHPARSGPSSASCRHPCPARVLRCAVPSRDRSGRVPGGPPDPSVGVRVGASLCAASSRRFLPPSVLVGCASLAAACVILLMLRLEGCSRCGHGRIASMTVGEWWWVVSGNSYAGFMWGDLGVSLVSISILIPIPRPMRGQWERPR